MMTLVLFFYRITVILLKSHHFITLFLLQHFMKWYLTDQVYIIMIHSIAFNEGCCSESPGGAAQLLNDSTCYFR